LKISKLYLSSSKLYPREYTEKIELKSHKANSKKYDNVYLSFLSPNDESWAKN